MMSQNPFFKPSTWPFLAPQFDKIQIEHYRPAFAEGIKQQLAEIEIIATLMDPPTFKNTLEAIELSGDLLKRVTQVFYNMSGAHTNEAIQEIQVEMAPKLAAHSDDIRMNQKLFARIKKVYTGRKAADLTEEQLRVLEEQYNGFVRAGAELTPQQQDRIRQINGRQSTLTTAFQNNLMTITKQRYLVVDDVQDLIGMDPADINAAAEAATKRGHAGKYVLTITNTTRQPQLRSLQNRDLRKKLWEASAYRAQGKNNGFECFVDNRPILLEIAQLRAERASILGFASHAAFQLEPQMAKTPNAARKMLTDLIPSLRHKTDLEALEIKEAMLKDGCTFEPRPWDAEYYAEKVRRAKYDFDESSVNAYFEMGNVLKNGVFFTMNRLYGVDFNERHDLPVYHPEVRVFDVMDHDGTQLGLFYADYLQRDSKRGGAWMSSFVNQSRLLNERPVIVNVMNIPRPPEGEPTLIGFDEVKTMFHEMGHGLHGLFSNVTYPSVSGTSVPRDFVEFPSTFEEDWAMHPEVLANYARHHKTGESIPAVLLEKMLSARKFNQGFETTEYVAAALLDLDWHSLTTSEIPTDVEAFETESMVRHDLENPQIPPRYKSAYFAHVWAGGYSASYYAYMWSEVLAADAFAHMIAQGGLTRKNGDLFRKTILAKGGSRNPMPMYEDFRGEPPTVTALLLRRGLTAKK